MGTSEFDPATEGGGGVDSRPNQSEPPPSTQEKATLEATETTGRELFELLREFGVSPGDPGGRKRLSEKLAGEGMSAEDLRLICETKAGEAEDPGALIYFVCTNGWRDYADDIAYAKALAAARPQRHGKGRRRDCGPTNGPTPHELRRATLDAESYVSERVLTDGKTVEFVAGQMNWTEERVREVCGL